MFTRKDKITIYNLLLEKYSLGDKIEEKELIKYLNDNGLNNKEFSYNSYQSLFKDLSEFLKEVVVDQKKYYLLKNYEEKINTLNQNLARNNNFHRSNTFTGYDDQIKKEKKFVKTNNESFNKLTKNLIKNEKKVLKKLDDVEKGKITTLILKNFNVDTFYPLSLISQYLEDNHIDYKEYGFKKMKLFFKQFSNVKMQDRVTDKVPACYLSFSKLNKEKVDNQADLNKKSTSDKKENTLPNKDEIFIPEKIISLYNEIFSRNENADEIQKILKDAYSDSINNSSYKIKDDSIIVPLSSKENENNIFVIKKSTSKTDYKYFLSYLGEKEKPKPGDLFLDTISFDDYDTRIIELSKLARKESWCYINSKDKYIILKIYLQYTFYKLSTENKIAISDDKKYLAFNTGLVDDNFQYIYLLAYLKDKEKNNYSFLTFTTVGVKGNGKLIVENFNPIPLKADYINNPSELYFDVNENLVIDYDHILIDNLPRLPFSFILSSTNNVEISKLIKQFLVSSPIQKEKIYEDLKNIVRKDKYTYQNLKFALEKAIDYVLKEVENDYHIVLPCYYPSRNALSLLLPLKLGKKNTIDCFLVVEKMPSNNYQGQTILPVKQAYTNARLIGPTTYTYLDPDKIND